LIFSHNGVIIVSESEGSVMTNIEMREAKKQLHTVIIDTILKYNPNDKEFDELLDYIINLGKNEKNY
jgi:hypothetical protein